MQKYGQTKATRWDEEKEHSSSSLMDGWRDVSRHKQAKYGSVLLTWHACLSNSKGQQWEQNRKEGSVLSQAGRVKTGERAKR